MTYLDTMSTSYPTWSWIVWTVGAVCLIGSAIAIYKSGQNHGVWLVGISALVIGVVLLAIPYSEVLKSQESDSDGSQPSQNRDNLKANIKAKYDVQDIVDDYPNYPLRARGTSQEVVVVTPQGQTVIFVLKQDPKTFEPTLLDTAIQSGTAPTGAITVKDITR